MKWLGSIVITLQVAVLVVLLLYPPMKIKHGQERVIRDTITWVDTFVEVRPMVQKVVRHDTITVSDNIDSAEIRYIHDTISNTVQVEVPITQSVYEDSTYRAVISGYHTSLDTMEVKNRMVIERYKPVKKWFGLGVGVGYDVFNKRPVLTVGANINLLNF